MGGGEDRRVWEGEEEEERGWEEEEEGGWKGRGRRDRQTVPGMCGLSARSCLQSLPAKSSVVPKPTILP